MNDESASVSSVNDVDAAKLEVERAERALSRSLHEVSDAGVATLKRAAGVARPVLIGAAAVVGVVWIVRSIRRAGQPAWRRPPPTERSVLGEVLRAAALSLASTAARRLADRLIHEPRGMQSTSAGRAGAPHFLLSNR